jgi:hypothetical protein
MSKYSERGRQIEREEIDTYKTLDDIVCIRQRLDKECEKYSEKRGREREREKRDKRIKTINDRM